MTDYNNIFTSKLLYIQKCKTEEDAYVSSSIYSCKFTYPQATTPTIARIRITCIYFKNDDNTILPSAGTIEKWSDKGWQLFEEYCDDQEDFINEEVYRKRLLCMARSFMTGIEMNNFSKTNVRPDVVKEKITKKASDLKIIDFTTKKKKKDEFDKL